LNPSIIAYASLPATLEFSLQKINAPRLGRVQCLFWEQPTRARGRLFQEHELRSISLGTTHSKGIYVTESTSRKLTFNFFLMILNGYWMDITRKKGIFMKCLAD